METILGVANYEQVEEGWCFTMQLLCVETK